MEMSNHTTEDFVLDPEFRKWVLSPDTGSNMRWERYLDKNPSSREAILLAKNIVLNLAHTGFDKEGLSEADKVRMWDKIKEGAAQKAVLKSTGVVVVPISSEAVLNKKRVIKARFPTFWRYASLILFSLGFGWLWNITKVGHDEEVPAVVKWQNYETPLGVKSTVTLSDGSAVTLNSGTTISYRENFSGPKREIYMEGEAFFMVAPDSLKPFLVYAGGVSTMALGTSFNIKAFGNETTEISLVTGSVEVKQQNGENVARISPGEGVLFNSNADKWKRQKVDLDRITAWMNKTIVFDNTPFERAVHILENWYGVEIKLENYAGRDLKVTGRYQDETLKNILEGLGYGFGIKYRINGKKVTVTFEK
jgi:transmembrane sensor